MSASLVLNCEVTGVCDRWEVCVALRVRSSCVHPVGPLRYPQPEFGCSHNIPVGRPASPWITIPGGSEATAQTVESDVRLQSGVPHRPPSLWQVPDANKMAEVRPWLTTETWSCSLSWCSALRIKGSAARCPARAQCGHECCCLRSTGCHNVNQCDQHLKQ